MEYADVIREVAKAIQEEIEYHQQGPRWDDLHEDSKASWCAVARVAINKYREVT
jgi:hypothetical protein